MAVTSIWPVKSNVGNVIRYTRNPEKTTTEYAMDIASLHSIDNVIQYTANDIKTEQRKYVSCLNCSEDSAVQQFMMVKRLFGKTDGRQCYHGYQSFDEGEVTAETAHEIGVKLAEELWGDRFQVVIATHLNTGHFHNHFVINSVSDVDGMKFYNSHEDYRKMREVSDRLCRQYGLSVIQNNKGKSKSYSEWLAEKEGRLTKRDTIRRDIDTAIRASTTESGFVAVMTEMGYSFKTRTDTGKRLKYPALKPPDAKGWFRFHTLGEGYNLDEVIDRVYKNKIKLYPFPDLAKPRTIRHGKVKNYKKHSSIYRLYLRYCYQLKIIKHRPTSVKRVSFLLREDVVKLDKYIQQTQILGKYHINTTDELENVKAQLNTKKEQLTLQREELRKNLRRTSLTDSSQSQAVRDEIAQLTKQLREIRKEVHSIDDIKQRSAQVETNLKQLTHDKTQSNKEINRYEPELRRSRTAGQDDPERR